MRVQKQSEANRQGHIQPFNPWTNIFTQVNVHEQKRQLAEDGFFGPLWLYASDQKTLLMSYIFLARTNRLIGKVDAVDPIAPVKYALVLRCFRSQYRHVTSSQALDPWLHALGFPSSSRHSTCVNHKDLVSSTHNFLKICLSDARCPLPVRCWLAAQFRMVVTEPTCFKDDCAKKGILPDRMAVPSVCEGPMSPIKKNRQVPKRCSPCQKMRACQDAVSAARCNKKVALQQPR